jgi:hypothetical protein
VTAEPNWVIPPIILPRENFPVASLVFSAASPALAIESLRACYALAKSRLVEEVFPMTSANLVMAAFCSSVY